MRWPLSLRTRFVLLVVAGAVLPLGLIGFWLTQTAARSGEQLLRERLVQTLELSAREVSGRWPGLRSTLLTIAESEPVQRRLTGAEGVTGSLAENEDTDATPILAVRLYDSEGTQVAANEPSQSAVSGPFGPGLLVALPVYRGRTSRQIGTLEFEVAISGLLGDVSRQTSPLGTVLAAVDPSSGASLLPLPFDASLVEEGRFVWGGEEWLTDQRVLADPPLVLVAAAPLTPLTALFEDAAWRGLLVLFVVAGAVILAAVALTARMTRSLDALAAAADAVARGQLDQRVEPIGTDEIGRVASTFNAMTETLRRTLRELADRQALAAVGEFAASLSHEIRNALSSIRLDLQVMGERLPEDPAITEPHQQALYEVGRLDETVTGALALARSGRLRKVTLDLWTPLRAACSAARSEFADRHARLEIEQQKDTPISVTGDPAALEQLFLNVLLNAAQALPAGGAATVRVSADDDATSVTITDDGPGIPAQALDRVFEAFYSTRDGGTGLGLSISRRIAQAHGGQLRIKSQEGTGTIVEVVLPVFV